MNNLKTRVTALIMAILLTASTQVSASDAEALSAAGADANNFGSTSQSGPSNVVSGAPVRPSDTAFDPATELPNYTTNPPEASYYSDQSTMEEDAFAKTQDDTCTETDCSSGAASQVVESFNTRPNFVIDPDTDPLLIDSQATLDDPESVMGTIAAGYSGCETVPSSCITEFTNQNCDEALAFEDNVCNSVINVTVDYPANCEAGQVILQQLRVINRRKADDNAWVRVICRPDLTDTVMIQMAMNEGSNHPVPPPSAWRTYYLPQTDPANYTVTYHTGTYIEDSEGENIGVNWTGSHLYQKNYLDTYLVTFSGSRRNYVLVFYTGGCDVAANTCSYTFEYQDIWYRSTQLTDCYGWGTCFDLNIQVGSYYYFYRRSPVTSSTANFTRPALDTVISEETVDNCATYDAISYCSRTVGPACIDGPSTKNINGTDVFKECWEYESTYSCSASGSTNSCQAFRDQGCTQIDSTCASSFPSGQCSVFDQTMQCPTTTCSEETTICGDQVYCVDGSCVDQTYDPNTDAAESFTQLAMLDETAKAFEESMDINSLFEGIDQRCRIGIVSALTYDCCDESGVINGVWPQCNETELDLAYANDTDRTHYVGSYCSREWGCPLCFCVERKRTYCTFTSKLGRILQEQGRLQLGIGWGGRRSPNCEALTIEQIQSLDFTQIDFSEFYDDAMTGLNTVDQSAVQSAIENKLNIIYGQ